MTCTVLVCKNTTCSGQGSAKVFSAFQSQVPEGVTVKTSGCLGECGSGPMVLVTSPESAQKIAREAWYAHVSPSDVPLIVTQHIKGGQVVRQKLYAKYHPETKSVTGWLIVFGILLTLILLIVGMLASQSPYA